MPYKFRRDLDPLDNELLEKALESAWTAVKQKPSQLDLDSDEQLESELRRELFEIARSYSASDAETLRRDVLLAKHLASMGIFDSLD
jgi:hypothetical protein